MTNTFEDLHHLVAVFLSEILRSRRTSIHRAAEISRKLTKGLFSINSEPEVLRLLTDLEKDFEELTALKQVLHFGYKESDVKVYEREIKEYAATLSERDLVSSAKFLQDAARPVCTIQHLCLQYPEFCDYLLNTEKRALVENILPAHN